MNNHSLLLTERWGVLFLTLLTQEFGEFLFLCTTSHKAYRIFWHVSISIMLWDFYILKFTFFCLLSARRFLVQKYDFGVQLELQATCTLHFNPTKDKNNDWKRFCAKAFTRFHFAASCTLGVSASWVRPLSSYCFLNDLHQATLTKLHQSRR